MMQAENKWFLDNNKQRRLGWGGGGGGGEEGEKKRRYSSTQWHVHDPSKMVNKHSLPVLNLMSPPQKEDNVNDENSQRIPKENKKV